MRAEFVFCVEEEASKQGCCKARSSDRSLGPLLSFSFANAKSILECFLASILDLLPTTRSDRHHQHRLASLHRKELVAIDRVTKL